MTTTRKFSVPVLLLFVAIGVTGYAQQTVLPAETPITLKLRNAITTKNAVEGQRVLTDIEEPSLLPPGSIILGQVRGVKRSGMVWGRARLGFEFHTLQLPNGQKVRINAALHRIDNMQASEHEIEASPTISRDVNSMIRYGVGGTLIGAAAGAASHLDQRQLRNGRDLIIDGAKRGSVSGAALGTSVGLLVNLLRRGEDLRFNAGAELVLILIEPVHF